jgi:hypothetical protein
MASLTANTAKKKAWGSLSVRTETEGQVDRLRSAYMKLNGADISEDAIIQFLLKDVSAKDLPKPALIDMAGK